MMLVGLLLGFGWAWLRFFRRGKSPRGGMVGSSGQVGTICLVDLYFMFGFIYRKPSMCVLARTFLYLIYALLWGKMLGGLNPSTDLLVGSTSQYGPVLTELPSQLKLKQTSSHDTPAIPLSDQEEETRTLMQDSTIPSVVSTGPNTIANQIPGWVQRLNASMCSKNTRCEHSFNFMWTNLNHNFCHFCELCGLFTQANYLF